MNRLPVPTVALLQGACFGGGIGVISACDVVIAADESVFSITEVRWGLTAAIIIPQLCDAIGVRQVRRYALTGERFDAEEARRIGLVHEVVPLQLAGRLLGQRLSNNYWPIVAGRACRDETAGSGERVGRHGERRPSVESPRRDACGQAPDY